MDAIEFARAKKRMCLLYLEDCGKCPLSEIEDCSLGSHFTTDERDKTIIETVEAWAKEHPLKTRQSEFLKSFPNAKRGMYGTIDVCPGDMNTDIPCDGKCEKCLKDYWFAEVE